MTVRELNREQLDELKNSYFWTVKNEYMHPECIPDDAIYDYYSWIHFVEDDFFCGKEEN